MTVWSTIGAKAGVKRAGRKLAALLSAGALIWGQTAPAYATIDNTVDVTFTMNGNTLTVSATENADVENAAPGIALDKTATFNDGGNGATPGDTITYSFRVENTGNVTLRDVAVTELFSGFGTAPVIVTPVVVTTDSGTVPPAQLAAAGQLNDSSDAGSNDGDWDVLGPRDVITFTATYNIFQEDIDAGQVTNNATAAGQTPAGQTVSAADNTITAFNGTSSLTFTKTGTLNQTVVAPGTRVDAGDTIAYQMTVTNTGTTTLTNVTVSDPLLNVGLPSQQRFYAAVDAIRAGADPVSTASLAPVMRATYAAESKLHQSTPDIYAALHAERKLFQITGVPGSPRAGDTIGIVFHLVNTGAAPLTSVTAAQEEADAYGGTLDILLPLASDTTSLLFTHVLTEADIANGAITAPGLVTAQARDKELSLKQDAPIPLAGMMSVDDVITAVIVPTTPQTLAPGASFTFTATLTLNQTQVNQGVVNNTATASGRAPDGTTLSVQDTESVTLPPDARLGLVKTASVNLGSDGIATPGDLITYTFIVSNPGNVGISGISVTDPLGPMTLTPAAPPTIALAPGTSNSTKFRLVYALTQADIDAGFVTNLATVNGLAPGGVAVTDTSHPTDPAQNGNTIVALTPSPRIALVKRAGAIADLNTSGATDIGDAITYTFEVSNLGNVALNAPVITDPLPGLPPATYVSGNTGAVTFDPGETWIFASTYNFTSATTPAPTSQDLIDAGQISNTATVSATPSTGGAAVTDTSHPTSQTQDGPTVSAIAPAPRIAVIKTVSAINDNNGNSITDAGDDIVYAFDVRNLGNVTLSNITINDPLAGGPLPMTLSTLAPGASDTTTFFFTYTVTGLDMNAGRVTNQATASGRTPANATVTDQSDNSSPDEDDATVTPIVSQPAIAILKFVTEIEDVNGNNQSDAGDKIIYAFTVRNTGNEPLTQVTVTDPLVTVSGGPIGTLLAGDTDTTTFTAEYVLTAADVARGFVTNSALASGTSPNNTIVTDDSDAESFDEDDATLTYLAVTPRIALVKRSTGITDTNGNGTQDAGDTITYAFTVTNTGNAPLTNVTITDPNAVVTGGPIATLGISQSDATTFTAVHVITQDDLRANGVTNQATASGTPPGGTRVSDLSDDASVTEDDPTFTALAGIPQIAVVKTVDSIDDRNGNGITDVGDVINYSFAITNTGNVTLEDVRLTDVLADVTGTVITTLAPGVTNSSAFSGTHLITPADAEAGEVVNQATVTARSLTGVVVSDASDNAGVAGNSPTVTPVAKSVPVLSKIANKSEIRRGERIAYTITASNLTTGPYTLVDTLPPGFTYVPKTAVLNGVAVTPAGGGQVLSFSGLTPDSKGEVSLKMTLMAGTTLATGRFVNRVTLFDEASGTRLARAEATVTIREEHVFDCGEIIGRVFEDLNGNGYADDGEPGVPGVRVVTVNGLLLTSDKNGRFHVSCADIPDASIGSNFILKLDISSLPDGYHLTTENPRDVRLTRGKVTKLNFGVARSCDVGLDIRKDAFIGNSAELRPKWVKGLDDLTSVLRNCPGALTITYTCGQYAPIAETRLAATEGALLAKWKALGTPYPLSVKTQLDCEK